MTKDVINLETALVEFDRFVEAMDLDVHDASLSDEDKQDVSVHKDLIVKHIMRGSLVINDRGEPVFTPKRSDNRDPLTFYEPDGAALMEMDKKKSSQDVGKMFALLGALTKSTPATFARMKMKDLKVCQAVMTLFLG